MSGPEVPIEQALTPREREVLVMVAEGRTNREIGSALFITESNAGVHVSNILAKLGVGSRTEAASLAIRAGLVMGLPAASAKAEPAGADALAADEPDEPATPTGFRAQLRDQWRRHPRLMTGAASAAVVLLAVTGGLGYALVTRQASATAPLRSPTASAESVAQSPSDGAASSASASETASPSASASPSPSAEASPSSTAAVSAPSPEPGSPPSGSWRPTGPLIQDRSFHTTTLLADGTVLVAGGKRVGYEEALRSAEVFDPESEEWSAAGQMAEERLGHTATLLPDGTVLVAGGRLYPPGEQLEGQEVYLSSAELYDPQTNRWTPTGSMHSRHYAHTATLLDDGTVLVAGCTPCFHPDGSPIVSAEVYDPASGEWSVVGDMIRPSAVGHSATLLEDGTVLAVGGDGYLASARAVQVYDPGSRSWTSARPVAEERTLHVAVRLGDGSVLVSGGGSRGVMGYRVFFATAASERYDPDTGRWRRVGDLSIPRVDHSATLMDDGTVLVTGGAAPAPILVAGDRGARILGDAELYDPATRRWTPWQSLSQPRARHAVVLVEGGRILVVGGEPEGTISPEATELYEPGD